MGSPRTPRSACRFSRTPGFEVPAITKMNRIQVLLLIAAAIVVVAIALSSQTGEDAPPAFFQAAMAFFSQAPTTILWLLAALGIGGWAGKLLDPERWELLDRECILLAIGIVSMVWLDSVLGALGILHLPGVAFFALAIPAFIGVLRIRNWRKPGAVSRQSNWALSATIIPVAILLIAALSTPGWLWMTEFGGYDVLSYHLQLPREWIMLGGIVETPHNAYGYLPNGVEAAFMHLGLLNGGMWNAVESTQLLVAGWTILAVLLCARTARQFVPEDSRPFTAALAAAFLLATPWVIVVGSLAYDESAVLLALAAMLLLLMSGKELDWRGGVLLGVLAGGACLAKLSSGILLVIPLAVGSLFILRRGQWIPLAASAALAALVVLSPWFLRNAIWTGNPVFPFLTSLFGSGDWSAEQLTIWNSAHGGRGELGTRMTALFNEFLREGIGPAPAENEPWLPQWSIMPWLGAAGAMVLLLRPERDSLRRSAAALGLFVIVSVVMWILLTHAKARFLVPTAVPLAILFAAGATFLFKSSVMRVIPIVGMWILALVPLGIYLQEGHGMPAWGIDRQPAFQGDLEKQLMEMTENDQQIGQLVQSASPGFFLNHLLPPESRVLFLGEAAPFHLRMQSRNGPRFAYSTVWTRGPLERLIQQGGTPGDWVQALNDQGFTHVYIHPGMLERWNRSGWLASELSTDNLADFTSQLNPMHRFANGSAVFRIPPPQPAIEAP